MIQVVGGSPMHGYKTLLCLDTQGHIWFNYPKYKCLDQIHLLYMLTIANMLNCTYTLLCTVLPPRESGHIEYCIYYIYCILNADPDSGEKMNADPCGSGSTALTTANFEL